MLVSVDPGKSGAIAGFSMDGELMDLFKLKTAKGQRFFNYIHMKYFEGKFDPAIHIVMEQILDHTKGQSSVATNTTAVNWGIQYAIAVLSDSDIITVPPKEWKKYFDLSKDKDASVEKASEYVDISNFIIGRMRKPNHDLAEAFLIGRYYGETKLGWHKT